MIATAPLTRPLAASAVPDEGVEVEIVAESAERAALAAANETLSVESFVARLRIRPFGRDGLEVAGEVEAETTRTCVVTLEPFVERVREPVSVRFVPGAPTDVSETEDDPPDPLIGGAIDLGAIAAEFFTLGLDPYPRKPGAAFDAGMGQGDEASPFAALKGLKARDGGD